MSGNLPYVWNMAPGVLKIPFILFSMFYAKNIQNCILRGTFITSSMNFTNWAWNRPTYANRPIKPNFGNGKRVGGGYLLHLIAYFEALGSIESIFRHNLNFLNIWWRSRAFFLNKIKNALERHHVTIAIWKIHFRNQ